MPTSRSTAMPSFQRIFLFFSLAALIAMSIGCDDLSGTVEQGPMWDFHAPDMNIIVPSGEDADEAMYSVSGLNHYHDGSPGLFDDLGLDEEQLAAIDEAFATARNELRELGEAARDDEISEEEFLEGARAIHEKLRQAIEEILSDEQLAELESRRRVRLLAMLNFKLDNHVERIERRVRFMTLLLGLTDEQIAAVTEILNGVVEPLTAVRDQLELEEISTNEAREAIVAIHRATRQAIRDELLTIQAAKFDQKRRGWICRRHRWIR